jgi:hypothetical protein
MHRALDFLVWELLGGGTHLTIDEQEQCMYSPRVMFTCSINVHGNADYIDMVVI